MLNFCTIVDSQNGSIAIVNRTLIMVVIKTKTNLEGQMHFHNPDKRVIHVLVQNDSIPTIVMLCRWGGSEERGLRFKS